eukprot:1102559-Heterocapsa_arctica.AAC.1
MHGFGATQAASDPVGRESGSSSPMSFPNISRGSEGRYVSTADSGVHYCPSGRPHGRWTPQPTTPAA